MKESNKKQLYYGLLFIVTSLTSIQILRGIAIIISMFQGDFRLENEYASSLIYLAFFILFLVVFLIKTPKEISFLGSLYYIFLSLSFIWFNFISLVGLALRAAAGGASSYDLDEEGNAISFSPFIDAWNYVWLVFSVMGICLGVYFFYKTFKLRTYFLVPAQIVLLLLINFCITVIGDFYISPHSSLP